MNISIATSLASENFNQMPKGDRIQTVLNMVDEEE